MSDDSTLLREACTAVGWSPPPGDADAITSWCLDRCKTIAGGQDREHAQNAVRGAREAARAGNLEYAVAGLRVAQQATSGGV